MAIRFYDEAVYNKIKSWVKDPKMRILKPDQTTRLFQMRADQEKDGPIRLPIIALSRDSTVTISSTNKKPMSFDGKKIGKSIDEDKTVQLNAIPIQLSYQLDIYTKKYEEGDEYLRNFIFNIINYPVLKIEIPYNGVNIEHIANLRILEDVNDNSDIPEKLFPDQFTRWTIKLEVQDAYLFSVPLNVNYDIEDADIDVLTLNNNKDIVDEVIESDVIK